MNRERKIYIYIYILGGSVYMYLSLCMYILTWACVRTHVHVCVCVCDIQMELKQKKKKLAAAQQTAPVNHGRNSDGCFQIQIPPPPEGRNGDNLRFSPKDNTENYERMGKRWQCKRNTEESWRHFKEQNLKK